MAVREDLEWTDWFLTPAPRLTDERIHIVERRLGVRLPADYLEVVRDRQGAAPSPSVVPLPDGSSTVLNALLHLEEQPEGLSLISAGCPDDLLPRWLVPFANDPGDNLFCFDYAADAAHPPVVFWPYDHLPDPPVWVADSFTALLSQLRP